MTVATVTRHVYTPRGSARRLFSERCDEVVLDGPVGTGKTRACLEKMHLVCLSRPNVRALIVRQTFRSIRASALKTYQEHVAKEWLADGSVHIYGGTIPQQVQYLRNGSTIDIAGMDQPTRIMSTEYDLIYAMEATELTEGGWIVLTSRARGTALSYRQVMGDCNPAHDKHWLNLRSMSGKCKMMPTYHRDNPVYFNDDGTMTPKGVEYMRKLDNMTGIWRKRYRDGLWVGAEGIIFDNFQPAVHVIDRFDIPTEWPRYWTVDFGYTNPFVLQCWAEDPDGRLFMYREIYHTGRRVEQHARTILDLVTDGEGRWKEPKPSAIICDHDPGAQADLHHTLQRHLGLGTTNARKSVAAGLQAVHSRLKVLPDGKARLYFLKDSLVATDNKLVEQGRPTCTVEEIGGYVWAPTKDAPVKENDHGCDATRYMVAHKDLNEPFSWGWV